MVGLDRRQRNGVVVFSDAMNDYHSEMEHVLGEGPKALQQAQGWMQLMARAGTLDYLAARLLQQAGTALKAGHGAGASASRRRRRGRRTARCRCRRCRCRCFCRARATGTLR